MKNKSVKSRVRDAAARSSEAATAPERKKKLFSIYRRAISNLRGSYIVLGAGTVFDLGGSYLTEPEVGALNQDSDKIRNDFAVVASDFRDILNAQLRALPDAS